MTDKQAREAFTGWVDLESPSSGNFIDDLRESFVAGWQAASQQNNGWLPINSDTPAHKELFLMRVAEPYSKAKYGVGSYLEYRDKRILADWNWAVEPTHWMLPPTPPKEIV